MIVFLKKKSLVTLFAVVFFLFCAVSYTKAQTGQNAVELPIIMYHNISNKSNKLGKYTVLDKQFEKDLLYIKENGFQTITMNELINFVELGKPLPEKPIIITFDDSYESFYAYAYPLLEKYNMTAVMSVIGIYADEYTQTEDHNLDYSHLNWTQIKELHDSEYVEIQNHTYDMHHNGNGRCGCGIKKQESVSQYAQILKKDIGRLQNDIFQHTGTLPTTFTYPFGYLCAESTDILKEMGFQATLSCTEVKNKITADKDCLFCLGRFNRASGETSEQFFSRILK